MDINSGPKIVGKIWCEDPDQHLRVAEEETRRGAGRGFEGISKLKDARATHALPRSYLHVSCLP